MIKKFKWQGYPWRITPFWGDYHKEKLSVWYGTHAVDMSIDNILELTCRFAPKKFTDGHTRNYDVGYVVCEEEFKYGTFEWTTKLPIGKHMWPGLWLGCNKEWPPEIDCMEAWSNKNKSNYIKRLFWLNVHPTVHWKEHGTHVSEAKFNTPFYRLRQKDWNDYKVEWTPEYISVYYNHKLIKKFTDPKMLAHFNKEDIKMFPIMTFDIWEDFNGEFTLDKYNEYKVKGSPFLIKSFKYTPYEKIHTCK